MGPMGSMFFKGFGSDLNPLTFLAKFIIIYLEVVFYRKMDNRA